MRKEPTCPYCGCEMVYPAMGCQYECPHCGSKGPDCNDSEETYAETVRRYDPPAKPLTLDQLKELPVPCVAILEDKTDMSIRPVTIWRVDDLAIMFRGDSGLWLEEYGITKRLWMCGTFRNPTDKERRAAVWMSP